MATRENQGLQIALIIFVILTIVLMVPTYMFFSSLQQEREANKRLTAEKKAAEDSQRKAVDEATKLKGMVDSKLGDSGKIEDFETQANKDFGAHGKGLAEGNQNYHFLVEQLVKQLNDANTKNNELTAEKNKLAAKIKADEDAKVTEFAKYDGAVKTAKSDLEKERSDFGSDREDLTKSKDDLSKKFADARKRHDSLNKKATDQVATLTSDKEKLDQRLREIYQKDLDAEKANEVADGAITWVNQRSRVVWINLGTDDGLRRQTLFSVYSSEKSNPADAKAKGKIEVINLKGSHLAEARIVEDDLSNPMMPKDLLFNPVWEGGKPESFALAGFMDIDQDGESDRQLIRNLISLNGGKIDAEVGDDGKRTGTMSIKTKYLVLGDEPTEKNESMIAEYSKIRDEAQLLGRRIVRVDEFVRYLGYKPEDRTVGLGVGARPDDFKARFPNGVQPKLPGSERGDSRKPAPTSGKLGN